MDKWDDEKLRNVVLSKAGNPRTVTDVRVWFYSVTHYSPYTLARLFANILLKQSRRSATVGFGNVRMVLFIRYLVCLGRS